jgi:hypothetical protein
MPNECSNCLTITSTAESDIVSILQDIHHEIPSVSVKQQYKLGIVIYYLTAWEPNFKFIEKIVDKYPLSWVKDEWNSEDGTSGIIIGKKNELKSMSWIDLSIEEENYFFSNPLD